MLILLLHTLLLPLKFLISLIIFVCYFPNFKFDSNMFVPTEKSMHDKSEDYIADFDIISLYDEDGDGCKFAGLYVGTIENKISWELFRRYIHPNGFMLRYPSLDSYKEDTPNFSGDMFAGLVEATITASNRCWFNHDDQLNLIKVWNKTLKTGTPLQFKHPLSNNKQDRGYLFKIFSLGDEALATLSFFAIGYKILGLKECKIWYNIFKFLCYPILFLPEIAIFINRIYGAAWYDEHSSMVIYSNTYHLTGDKIFKRAAYRLKHRYKYNPEILAYYYNMCYTIYKDNGKEDRDYLRDYGTINYWLKNYDTSIKGTEVADESYFAKYFSLRSMKSKQLSKFILPPKYVSSKYLWESKIVENSIGNRSKYTLDYLHLYRLAMYPL